jgi:KaiC/GvpD/RAD55 family RecA-like ATPase
MSRAETETYAFDDSLPIEPIEAGSTVFVAGPALSRAEDLALSLVADGGAAGDGMLFISTNNTSEKLLGSCQRLRPGFDAARTGVIDCSGQGLTPSKFDAEIKTISTQSDLTGIGMKFSALYEGLYMKADERVRTGLISLSSLLMYVDLRSLFRFVQTISGRIDSAGGLGVFSIDPTTHDEQTVNTLSQAADGRIEVREAEDGDADGELRVRGLPNQPEGWQPFSLPE